MDMQAAIREYAAKGYNLIPLAKGSKVPYQGIKLERYFNEKYPVEELLKLAATKEINLGIITGKTSNLAVIDVDTADKTALSEYLTLYPTDMIERTPIKGGAHLYYEYREGLPEILKIKHGDFYAGSHYVVVAPSVVEGKTYEWIKQGALGKLPQDLFEKSFDMQTGKYTRQQVLDLINQGLTTGLPDGQWNDTILYGSMVLSGDGLNQEAIYSLMKLMNKGAQPIPDRQVRSMIQRGMEYAAKDKYQKPDITPTSRSKEHVVEMSVSSYGDVWNKYATYEAHWLVEDWLLESAVLILAAPPERYKTWMAVDLAISVASGLPFLDQYEVKKTGNVLILQQEDFGPRYFSRFKNVERAKLDRAKLEVKITEEDGTFYYQPSGYDIANKIFFHEDAELSFDNEMSIDRLEQRIIETNAVLVIIDPFYSLSVNDDYFAKTAAKIRERIKTIRNRTGAAFFFVHHNNKGSTAEGVDSLSRNSIYGSQFVNAVMEGAIVAGRMKGMGANQIGVARYFKDADPKPITRINFHININAEDDGEAYRLDVSEDTEDLSIEIKQYLVDNGAQSSKELYNAFKHKFSSRSTFTRWLKAQEEKGIKQDGARGNYSVEPDGD